MKRVRYVVQITTEQQAALEKLEKMQDEESLWEIVIAYQNTLFYTASGLPFTYTIKIGKKGQLTKELIIDRREQSKTLTWSSIRVAFEKVMRDKAAGKGNYYDRPKAIGDIRGVSYAYSMFWRFGIIEVPEAVAEKMKGTPLSAE